MNLNGASQHQGIVVWSGTAAAPVDIRKHVNYSFTFHTTADLAADAVFEFQAAPASDVDPCIPGTFVPVEEVLTCVAAFGPVPTPLPHAAILIPAGTKKGAICTAALPCKPDAFVQPVAGSGPTASVQVVAILSGPK
jgi:hypothetical protein